MRQRTRLSAGVSLIEILLIVAMIGIITTILIPNLYDAFNKAIQKRTVADMHAIATGMVALYLDMNGVPSAGFSVHLGAYDPINHADVHKMLVPLYIDRLPKTDGWGHPYDYYYGKETFDFGHEIAFGIRSRGNDGKSESTAYAWGSFPPDEYFRDIVWLDGVFVTWPASAGEVADGGGIDCNQGIGNDAEGCDPGNSNQGDPSISNDEGGGAPGDPGRGGGDGGGKKDKG